MKKYVQWKNKFSATSNHHGNHCSPTKASLTTSRRCIVGCRDVASGPEPKPAELITFMDKTIQFNQLGIIEYKIAMHDLYNVNTNIKCRYGLYIHIFKGFIEESSEVKDCNICHIMWHGKQKMEAFPNGPSTLFQLFHRRSQWQTNWCGKCHVFFLLQGAYIYTSIYIYDNILYLQISTESGRSTTRNESPLKRRDLSGAEKLILWER